MDLWCVNVKKTNGVHFLVGKPSHAKSMCWNSIKMVSDTRVCRTRSLGLRTSSGCHCMSLVVRALGRHNPENSSSFSSGDDDQYPPEGDGLMGNNADKSHNAASQKSHYVNLDWREFRANLFAQEQAEKEKSDAYGLDAATQEAKPVLGKWAHPISVPENGCVLVATEKLDGFPIFERTAIFLLRSGTRHPQGGPFGVIINRPLHKKVKHMKSTNMNLATTFPDCSLHYGGPLEASIFLLKTEGKSGLPGFEQIVPGLCYGSRNSLDEAASLVKKGVVKPHDFQFFVGYAGWQLDQLQIEIESGFWYVAACSSDLIFDSLSNSSSEKLWEEILQLMGGHYSELSRKPKEDI